jgi:hypothetical protein
MTRAWAERNWMNALACARKRGIPNAVKSTNLRTVGRHRYSLVEMDPEWHASAFVFRFFGVLMLALLADYQAMEFDVKIELRDQGFEVSASIISEKI